MLAATAAWDVAGRPDPNWQGKAKTARTPPVPRLGVCALCGTRGDVFDHRRCVSDLWTSWDRLRHRHADPAGVGFCRACAWALRLRVAMQRPHVLDDAGFRQADPPILYATLALLPDRPRWAVCVPQSRQKHLVPWARLGTVRTDDETLPWTDSDVDRLGTYRGLRLLGFGETALGEPAPRWPILTKLDPAERQWALLRWHDLDPWRHHPAYMDVAARATRTPKET